MNGAGNSSSIITSNSGRWRRFGGGDELPRCSASGSTGVAGSESSNVTKATRSEDPRRDCEGSDSDHRGRAGGGSAGFLLALDLLPDLGSGVVIARWGARRCCHERRRHDRAAAGRHAAADVLVTVAREDWTPPPPPPTDAERAVAMMEDAEAGRVAARQGRPFVPRGAYRTGPEAKRVVAMRLHIEEPPDAFKLHIRATLSR